MNKPAMIKTQRLVLRPLNAPDRAAVTELLLSEEIAKTYMLPEFKSPAEAEGLFEAYMRLSNAPDRFVYGIDLDGRVIGLLNETEKTDDKIELGYLIHPAHWGNGYATETLAACIKALVELGYGTVSAGFFEENIASRRVMEKCGLRPAGKKATVTYRGQAHRCIYYQITLCDLHAAPALCSAFHELHEITAEDLTYVYNALKNRYPLVRTTTFALGEGHGFEEDFPILTAEAHGQFLWLYEYGGVFVLDILNTEKTAGTHNHPFNAPEAIKDILDFMEGRSDDQLSTLGR